MLLDRWRALLPAAWLNVAKRERRAKDAKDLQRSNGGFQGVDNDVGMSAWWERNGGGDSNGELAEAGQAAMLAFHLPDAVEAHGNNGDAKVFRQQTDAALEMSHFAGGRVVHLAFGKNQHAVVAVDRFAAEAETFAETGKLR